MLREQALAAWRLGGQQWKPWSSRCVSAVLQVDKRPSSRVHLVSCYAPTRAGSREDKDAFFQDLECIIASVPSGEIYVLLGDFNACVESRESVNEEWSEGPTRIWMYQRFWKRTFVLSCLASGYGVQHLVQEERHSQADMAASDVQAVELYRLCDDVTVG